MRARRPSKSGRAPLQSVQWDGAGLSLSSNQGRVTCLRWDRPMTRCAGEHPIGDAGVRGGESALSNGT
ncbi:hypothetical protein chiPu_0025614 [Chiloscyllium punctatum]|uniref:Uncharacterized protein n=1 Tax=Chiloscyllium punctatum TaxID=137246 RepID=A0A401TGX6_CHIPU|nr:hypothetical protein [Chiloscyllium punctatum]